MGAGAVTSANFDALVDDDTLDSAIGALSTEERHLLSMRLQASEAVFHARHLLRNLENEF